MSDAWVEVASFYVRTIGSIIVPIMLLYVGRLVNKADKLSNTLAEMKTSIATIVTELKSIEDLVRRTHVLEQKVARIEGICEATRGGFECGHVQDDEV